MSQNDHLVNPENTNTPLVYSSKDISRVSEKRPEYIYPLQPERIGLICDFFDEYSHAKHPRQLSLVPKMTEEEKIEDEETPEEESEKSEEKTDERN